MAKSHQRTPPTNLRPASSPQRYGAVVGTVEISTERPIQGRNGDHLQFYLNIGGTTAVQVDVNTQSRDGSQIGVYRADENFDVPEDKQIGLDTFVELSYQAIGLKDSDFTNTDYTRIESMVSADLQLAELVIAYGLTFKDPGPNGAGIHETHFTNQPGKDGALALYMPASDGGQAKRLWYFFKFQTDSIG